MADILNIGTSALLSLQRAISTTGHNIANVNTEGYSRQRVDLDTLTPQLQGGSYFGSGVAVAGVERVYDQFLTAEVWNRSSSNSQYNAYYDLASRLDGVLSDSNVGLSSSLNQFFSALQDVANNPSSLAERSVLIGDAQVLVDKFHALSSTLSSVNSEVNARLETGIQEINSLANNIAELNAEIVAASATGGSPNDLLDTRDQLIRDLSEKVGITTLEQGDGSINIMIGNGQALVVGGTASQLQTITSPYDVTRTEIGLQSSAGVINISRFITGGELGGVFDFRDQVLDPARDQLGLLAFGLTETFNAQHQLGQDLNGQLGGDFFQALNPQSLQHTANAGTASVSLSVSDISALTADQYSLRYDGSQWELTNRTTGAVQTGAGPFNVNGLTIDISGVPANGDSFLIQPVRQGGSLMELAISDAEAIAAASPVRVSIVTGNGGSGAIDSLVVNDNTSLPLASAITLTFNPDALGAGVPGYDVTGIVAGPIAYDPATESAGKTVTLAGMDITLSGVPQTGDALGIENNVGGVGDNRNMLALAGLQSEPLLDGSSASYRDVYSGLVANVAVKTRQAENAASSEAVLLAQAVEARDSVSGVNLDEEAARLLQLQQSYQAAAQIIATADTLFQTLLAATRR